MNEGEKVVSKSLWGEEGFCCFSEVLASISLAIMVHSLAINVLDLVVNSLLHCLFIEFIYELIDPSSFPIMIGMDHLMEQHCGLLLDPTLIILCIVNFNVALFFRQVPILTQPFLRRVEACSMSWLSIVGISFISVNSHSFKNFNNVWWDNLDDFKKI